MMSVSALPTCRILLANDSRLLRDALKRAITRVPGLRVVGETSEPDELPTAMSQTGAEWVFVSLSQDGSLPKAAEDLLVRHRPVRVIAVTSDLSHIEMRWMEPRQESLDGLSLDQLIDRLRMRSGDDHPDTHS